MAHIDADQSGWVAVEDGLPKSHDDMVWIFVAEISDGKLQSYSFHRGEYFDGKWYKDGIWPVDDFVVTHWKKGEVPDRFKEEVSTWDK